MTTEEYEKIKGMIADLKIRAYNLGKAMACEDTTITEKKKRYKRTFDVTNNLLDYIASFVEVGMMNKKEFKKWVDKTVREYNADFKVKCLEFKEQGKIILVDEDTAQTGMSKCDVEQFDFATGLAIAYAKLRGLEVPTIEVDGKNKFERVKYGNTYWIIEVDSDGIAYRPFEERHLTADERCFNSNNYFRTEERAEEVADKIKMLLRLERLHDTFCPDYKPSNCDYKYCVSYSLSDEKWRVFSYTNYDNKTNVYFPSQEIAQQVADILNKEND